MAKRAAFYVDKNEIEKFFNVQTNREVLFEPNYNITPGHHIPIIFFSEGEFEIKKARWGNKPGMQNNIAVENLSSVEGKNSKRIIVPLSGFYVWKDDNEKGYPFFVRLMSNEALHVAGLLYEDDYFEIVIMESNILIQPMAENMPLILDKSQSYDWLYGKLSGEEIKSGAEHRPLTDFSVTRVSKKVNDPSNNSKELIQPIPK